MSLLFSHQEVREGQGPVLKKMYQSFLEHDTLLVEAPTGLGKTACSISAALSVALEKGGTVIFVTNRQTQHQIAVETVSALKEKYELDFGVVDLYGKKSLCNHPVEKLNQQEFTEFCKQMVAAKTCEYYTNVYDNRGPTLDAEHALSTIGTENIVGAENLKRYADSLGLCAYEITSLQLRNAKVVIADYNHVFHPSINRTLLKRLGKSWSDLYLIVDEAHNLAERCMRILSQKMNSQIIQYAIKEADRYELSQSKEYLEKVFKALYVLSSEEEELLHPDDLTALLPPLSEMLQTFDSATEFVYTKQRKSFINSVAEFLRLWVQDGSEFVRSIVDDGLVRIEVNCVHPGSLIVPVTQDVRSTVFMSATLQPAQFHQHMLGLPNVEHAHFSSPFPRENRQILIDDTISTEFKLRTEQHYKELALRIQNIVSIVPGRSAIFFPSYHYIDKVVPLLSVKTIVEKPGLSLSNKRNLFNSFTSIDKGVLCAVNGGSFSEGVDFDGDKLKCVIICGVPLQPPSKKMQYIQSYYRHHFGEGWTYAFLFPAMNRCIQSAGRCIRSAKDKGSIIYLDRRFAREPYRSCLNDSHLHEDLLQTINQFWG